MMIAAYSLTVATVFAVLHELAPRAADALVLFFIVAVLFPAVWHDLGGRGRPHA